MAYFSNNYITTNTIINITITITTMLGAPEADAETQFIVWDVH